MTNRYMKHAQTALENPPVYRDPSILFPLTINMLEDEEFISKSSNEEKPLEGDNPLRRSSSFDADLAIRCISIALLIRLNPEPRGRKPRSVEKPDGFLKTLASYSS